MKKTASTGGEAAASTKVETALHRSLNRYFADLDGCKPGNLHKLVLGHVESCLIRNIWERSGRNQTQAAKMLGINRNSLRSKLKLYKIEGAAGGRRKRAPQQKAKP